MKNDEKNASSEHQNKDSKSHEAEKRKHRIAKAQFHHYSEGTRHRFDREKAKEISGSRRSQEKRTKGHKKR